MPDIEYTCDDCRRERVQFTQLGVKTSPACAQLWRQAFQRNQIAWSCVTSIFGIWLSRLCNDAITHAPSVCGLSRHDLEDVVQDVWLNIWRYATRNTEAAQDLLANEDLSRVLGLVKTTAKIRVVEICRGKRLLELYSVLEESENPSEVPTRVENALRVEPVDVDTRIDMLASLKRNIASARELIVAELMFLQQMKPQDVFELRSDHFNSVEEVNQVRQTLLRRIRSDYARQESVQSASLQFRLDSLEVHMNDNTPCPYDESTLHDYLNGHVSGEVRRSIELSPACAKSANQLEAMLVEMQPYLRDMVCPDSERLVAFQERRLTGINNLVVHRHVQKCPYCSAELSMIAAMDKGAEALQSEASGKSLGRLIYEFLFQPATVGLAPTLGEGSYVTVGYTPQVELLIRTIGTSAKHGNWLLFGRLRYADEQPVAQVETITLSERTDEDARPLEAVLDKTGAFSFTGLDAGLYELHVVTANEEFILHTLQIGNE